MKKIIIISLCLIFANTIKGQEYIPFPTDSATWLYFEYSNPHKDIVQSTGILGDTIINNLNFQKYGNLNTTEVYGYFHVNEKKVYYLNNNMVSNVQIDTNIRLIYDFNMAVGDSIFYPRYSISIQDTIVENSIIYVLNSIDTVFTNIDSRKCFRFSAIFGSSFIRSAVWIEGIGELHALNFIRHQQYIMGLESSDRFLLCFFHKNQHVYGTDCTVKVDEFVLKDNLLVYPNPFVDNFQIIIPEGFSAVGFSIYDINGKIIKSESISEFEKTISVNANTFKKGTYFMVLSDDKGKTMRKVVVKQ